MVLSWVVAWWHAGKHGTAERAESSTSGAVGSIKRKWAVSTGLSFWNFEGHPQWHTFQQGHTYSNKVKLPTMPLPMGLWGTFSFRPYIWHPITTGMKTFGVYWLDKTLVATNCEAKSIIRQHLWPVAQLSCFTLNKYVVSIKILTNWLAYHFLCFCKTAWNHFYFRI